MQAHLDRCKLSTAENKTLLIFLRHILHGANSVGLFYVLWFITICSYNYLFFSLCHVNYLYTTTIPHINSLPRPKHSLLLNHQQKWRSNDKTHHHWHAGMCNICTCCTDSNIRYGIVLVTVSMKHHKRWKESGHTP